MISEVDRGTAWEDGQMDGSFCFFVFKDEWENDTFSCYTTDRANALSVV